MEHALLCQVCEQLPVKWHIVTTIAYGKHFLEGDWCEECGGDVIEAGLCAEAVEL